MLSDYPHIRHAVRNTTEEKADINTPVQSVQVDGIVVLKILQHSKEYLPEMVTGQCMGMTSGTTMEITNCIPLPNQNDDAESKQYVEATNKLNAATNADMVIGWYGITWQEHHINANFIDTMSIYQSVLGAQNCVCLLFDPLKSLHGKLYLKALKLKPEFIKLYKENSDKKDFCQQVINSSQITSTDFFVELPVTIFNSHLIDEFLWELGTSPQYSLNCTTEDNVVASDLALSTYQTTSATAMVELSENVISELHKYLTLTRKKGSPEEDRNHKPSRIETLFLTSQLANLSRHTCDVSHVAFESIALCEALQKAAPVSAN